MSEAPLMLGVSGLRGIVGESLTPEVAVRYAAAFGAWLHEREGWNPTVFIASDGRAGWHSLSDSVRDGLLASGCHVIECGIAMTPTIGLLLNMYRHDGAVIITASHNPQEWNGLKLLVRDHHEVGSAADNLSPKQRIQHQRDIEMIAQSSCAPSPADAEQIIRRFLNASDAVLPGTESVHSVQLNVDHVEDHVQTVLSLVSEAVDSDLEETWFERIENMTVVVDSVNASGTRFVQGLFQELGCELVQLHGDNSGIFPHNPEPTAENLSGEGGLCDAVPGLKADVGFAQDPDGDRLAIVDEQGKYIGEEYTLVLAAMSILEARSSAPPPPVGELSPKATEGASAQTPSDRSAATSPVGDGGGESDTVICVNLSTSRMIDDVAARYGARVVRTAVGEANVVEAMKRLKKEGTNVILGGEGNGGVIWPEVTYVRDSLGAMALTLSLMARTGKTVSELVADVPSYAIVKRKQPLARKEDARPTIEKLTAHYSAMGEGVRVDTQDGVRIDFDAARAWVHVRASNTEPILRLIGEAPTREQVDAVLDEVQRLVDAG